MKKFIALVMVGVMALGMSTMAAVSPSASAVAATVEAAPANTTPAYVAEAAAENMTVGEYLNNAVATAPAGITGEAASEVKPIAVGTGAYINGVKTNYTIKLGKVDKNTALSASKLGKIVNAFTLKNKPAGSVQIAVYCKSVKAGDKITVYQLVNGTWKKLVSSVRAEHVDVVLEGNGAVVIVK